MASYDYSAYDPYDRGDNPWRIDPGPIDKIDMPRSAPAAKPGAGRVAEAVATRKKKKKLPEASDKLLARTSWVDPPARTPWVDPPARPPLAMPPGMPPPADVPAVTSGMLAGSGPERAAPLNTDPGAVGGVYNSTANNPTALRPTQSTGADAWLRQMLSAAMENWNSPKPRNPMFPGS